MTVTEDALEVTEVPAYVPPLCYVQSCTAIPPSEPCPCDVFAVWMTRSTGPLWKPACDTCKTRWETFGPVEAVRL